MKTIGKADKADFPEFGLEDINVKVDTGAYTSSIHCHYIKEINIDGQKFLEFQLLDPADPQYKNKTFKTADYNKKSVKNSFGSSEQRFVIHSKIVLFHKAYKIELSLSERSNMRFPILLGRKLLNRRFLVDTSKTNISYKLKLAREQKK